MAKHSPETIKQPDTPDPDEIEVLNPRYKGATPKMLVCAMIRTPKKTEQEDASHLEQGDNHTEI